MWEYSLCWRFQCRFVLSFSRGGYEANGLSEPVCVVKFIDASRYLVLILACASVLQEGGDFASVHGERSRHDSLSRLCRHKHHIVFFLTYRSFYSLSVRDTSAYIVPAAVSRAGAPFVPESVYEAGIYTHSKVKVGEQAASDHALD